MRGRAREIQRALAGEPARVFFKLNSLTDREVIDKIAEASCAGVRVDMIIRGISCLKPGVPGKTENVHVRSIVGRFLEHARVYAFGVDSDMIYLSSADMMTRNTEHRVEIAFPVLDPTCRALVHEYMGMQLRDNVKASDLLPDGTYARRHGAVPFDCQNYFMEQSPHTPPQPQPEKKSLGANAAGLLHRFFPCAAAPLLYWFNFANASRTSPEK